MNEYDIAAAYIKERIAVSLGDFRPELAIILGSGLGGLADEVEKPVVIPYGDIPGFSVSTAPNHRGRLVVGLLGGRRVICMQGRLHYYEGHSIRQIIFPVRVFARLGVGRLIVTNAAGGVNTGFAPGDLMLIRDMINYSGLNPLMGPNLDAFGPRFPDMSRAFDAELMALARRQAQALGLSLREGVYMWFSGPSFETPAEIRMARTLGADAVGMSTVPEVIVARHSGMRVLGISCITNMAAGILDQPLNHQEVLEVGERVRTKFAGLVDEIVRAM